MEKVSGLIVGFMLGAIATAGHQALWFGVIPIGIICAFALVISIVIWWGKVANQPTSTLWLGAGIILMMLLMFLIPHGAYIFVQGWQSWLWIFGMPIIVLITSVGMIRWRKKYGAGDEMVNPLKPER